MFQQFGQFGDALEKILEMDSTFLVAVAKHEDFKRLQRDAVAQRWQRLTQLESLDVTLLLPVEIQENVLGARRMEEEEEAEEWEEEQEEKQEEEEKEGQNEKEWFRIKRVYNM